MTWWILMVMCESPLSRGRNRCAYWRSARTLPRAVDRGGRRGTVVLLLFEEERDPLGDASAERGDFLRFGHAVRVRAHLVAGRHLHQPQLRLDDVFHDFESTEDGPP